jgi:RimJ/RimL family protein N-acetyltransferase
LNLVAVTADQVDALIRGETGDRPVAPGWPHADTAAGLGFVHGGGWGFLVIDEDGRIAGECGTKLPPRDGHVEIGYGLAAQSRGHRLGTAAVTELVTWLVSRPDVSVIEAEVHLSNTPSRRIVEGLGFVADDAPAQGYLRYRRTAG